MPFAQSHTSHGSKHEYESQQSAINAQRTPTKSRTTTANNYTSAPPEHNRPHQQTGNSSGSPTHQIDRRNAIYAYPEK